MGKKTADKIFEYLVDHNIIDLDGATTKQEIRKRIVKADRLDRLKYWQINEMTDEFSDRIVQEGTDDKLVNKKKYYVDKETEIIKFRQESLTVPKSKKRKEYKTTRYRNLETGRFIKDPRFNATKASFAIKKEDKK